MDDAERLRRRTAFDGDAAAYDAGRFAHPAWVFDRLEADGVLGPGARVLDVGPGTGQATLALLARGAHTTAVELGPNLARRLRSNAAGRPLEVIVGDFATVDLPADPFDLVLSANAFHWLDAVPALRRMGEVLRPGGRLAVSWTVMHDPGRPDPFGAALAPVYEEFIGPHRSSAAPYALNADSVAADVRASDGFGPVEVVADRSDLIFSTAQLVALYATYSEWAALPDGRRAEALDRIATIAREQFGGEVVRPRQTVLYLAERK